MTIQKHAEESQNLETLWKRLASENGYKAVRATWRLVERGPEIKNWLKNKINEKSNEFLSGPERRRAARTKQVLRLISERSK